MVSPMPALTASCGRSSLARRATSLPPWPSQTAAKVILQTHRTPGQRWWARQSLLHAEVTTQHTLRLSRLGRQALGATLVFMQQNLQPQQAWQQIAAPL